MIDSPSTDTGKHVTSFVGTGPHDSNRIRHHLYQRTGLADTNRGVAGQRMQQLGCAEALCRTSGKQDADNTPHGLSFRGEACGTPLRFAVISARIETAISAGRLLPIYRPAGP